MEFGEQKTKSGIIIKDDDGTSRGVRARWAKVLKVGPEQTELKAGDYILIEHGRWTRATKILVDGQEKKMQMIDYPRGLLVISKVKPKELELVGL
jgi:co-chaperonin GroES (HSP10)